VSISVSSCLCFCICTFVAFLFAILVLVTFCSLNLARFSQTRAFLPQGPYELALSWSVFFALRPSFRLPFWLS
jgi:hypothetical protein